jgi:cytochrome c biogenesis protein CcdA/thiol-disulfide isomerase/thioredoxin
MVLALLAYVGGVLTILSPCILPVLPFVFTRADRPFLRNGLPMLVGMALAFALVATLAAVAGAWAVRVNQYGRWAAMAVLALCGAALLLPGLAERLTRPLVALGGRLSAGADGDGSILPAALLGLATGLLWAPCAGPILGLILTGAALNGANAQTSMLLAAYAAGAATSLALALLVGGRLFAVMKRSLKAGEWIRRGLGAAVLIGVAIIALGLDTGLLTRVALDGGATRIEQALLDRLGPRPAPTTEDPNSPLPPPPPYRVPPPPPHAAPTPTLNTPPLTLTALKGRVVLLDFWTYSCINCIRALPYVEAWARRYADQGLVVIGVHTPEFAFEKQRSNVEQAIRRFGVAYPVAIDNDYAIWKAYDNAAWPAHYLIDAQGRLRHEHLGEGEYDKTEQAIRQLLAERNGRPVAGPMVGRPGAGVQAAPDFANALSQETFIGYEKAAAFASPQMRRDAAADYTLPKAFEPDRWGLAGRWRIGKEAATGLAPGGRAAFRFSARDLNMVLGADGGRPVRFRITLDGRPPGADPGVDVNAAGDGRIDGQRLYQLVRQKKPGGPDRLFEIEFLEPGAQAFSFTFG